MTAVEFLIKQLIFKTEFENLPNQYVLMSDKDIDNIIKQALEIEKEQKGYSEEDVREMLFMALYEPQEECCTTHTKDSIVRKVLKTFKSE